MRYVIRTLLKWQKLEQDKITTSILIVVCMAISGLCTWYSFNLSKISSIQITDWMKPKEQLAAQLDSTLINQAGSLLNLDSLNNSGRTTSFNTEQKAVVRVFDNQIKALVADSIYWEEYKTEENYQWVNRRKLDGIREKLRQLRLERDTSLLSLTADLSRSAASSASLRDTITNLLLTDTKQAIQRKQEEQEQKDKQHSFISMLVSSIAGYAVLVLLALGCIREVLYARNNIEPLPVIGPFDFQNFEHVKEVLAYPFTWAGRNIINNVRRRYSALPDLEQPAFETFAFDYEVQTEVIKLKPPKKKQAQTETRQGIGFKIASQIEEPESPKESVTNATVNGLPLKACQHCGRDFSQKVGWQKFCSEDCRMDYHANKHGQRFEPGKFHKKK